DKQNEDSNYVKCGKGKKTQKSSAVSWKGKFSLTTPFTEPFNTSLPHCHCPLPLPITSSPPQKPPRCRLIGKLRVKLSNRFGRVCQMARGFPSSIVGGVPLPVN